MIRQIVTIVRPKKSQKKVMRRKGSHRRSQMDLQPKHRYSERTLRVRDLKSLILQGS